MKLDAELLARLTRFCAYRERAKSEVIEKLRALSYQGSPEPYIEILEKENYLDEKRYAQAFVQGSTRIKGWGRNKIRAHLQLKRLPSVLIDEVLASIDQDEYRLKLEELTRKKLKNLGSKIDYPTRAKLMRYLQQKGYRSDEVLQIIERIKKAP